jgi:hypothetical protein
MPIAATVVADMQFATGSMITLINMATHLSGPASGNSKQCSGLPAVSGKLVEVIDMPLK